METDGYDNYAQDESRKRPLEDQSNGIGTKRFNGVGNRKYFDLMFVARLEYFQYTFLIFFYLNHIPYHIPNLITLSVLVFEISPSIKLMILVCLKVLCIFFYVNLILFRTIAETADSKLCCRCTDR